MQHSQHNVPHWLPSLLSSRFFAPCKHHAALPKPDLHFFCIGCGCHDSLCSNCVAQMHNGAGHELVQVRRSSYHDAVRVGEVNHLLDLNHIQVYVINGAKIVFLNGRPQAKPQKGAPYHCEACQRTLLDACRFCSIACKLTATEYDCSLRLTSRQHGNAGHVPRHTHAARPMALVAEVSDDSANHAPRTAGSGDSSLRKRKQRGNPLPPLVTDADEESSDDSGQRGGADVAGSHAFTLGQPGSRSKRVKVVPGSFKTEFLQEGVTVAKVPHLSPLRVTGEGLEAALLASPSSPVMQQHCGMVEHSARVRSRKGVPHRAPLA